MTKGRVLGSAPTSSAVPWGSISPVAGYPSPLEAAASSSGTSPHFPTNRFHVGDSTKQAAWRKAAQLEGCVESRSLLVPLKLRRVAPQEAKGFLLLHPGY